MTVYSAVLARHQTVQASARVENKLVFRLNSALLLATVFFAALYVFASNFLVAQRYSLDARKTQFNQLNTQLDVEIGYDTAPVLKGLLIFAQKSGMVEAKDTDSILQKEGFAILDR